MKWYDDSDLDLNRINSHELTEKIAMSIGRLDYEDVRRYPEFIQTAYFLLSFDCDLNMGGIFTCLENTIGQYMPEIIRAFRTIGDEQDAHILEEICRFASPERMRTEFLAKDPAEYQVMTFDECHELDEATEERIEELADQLYLETDLDIWALLDAYLKAALLKYAAADCECKRK